MACICGWRAAGPAERGAPLLRPPCAHGLRSHYPSADPRPASSCGDSKSGGGLPGVERSLSSLEAEGEEDAAGLPISMSTDEEGERALATQGHADRQAGRQAGAAECQMAWLCALLACCTALPVFACLMKGPSAPPGHTCRQPAQQRCRAQPARKLGGGARRRVAGSSARGGRSSGGGSISYWGARCQCAAQWLAPQPGWRAGSGGAACATKGALGAV